MIRTRDEDARPSYSRVYSLFFSVSPSLTVLTLSVTLSHYRSIDQSIDLSRILHTSLYLHTLILRIDLSLRAHFAHPRLSRAARTCRARGLADGAFDAGRASCKTGITRDSWRVGGGCVDS